MARQTVRIPATVAGTRIDVITHTNPHPDEMLCCFILEQWGTRDFLRQYAPKGKLEIGVGGGPFDDHTETSGTTSSVEKLAIALHVRKTPQILALVEYVHKNDTKASDQQFGLCKALTLMGQQNVPLEDMISWACAAFEVKTNELEPRRDFSLQYISMLLGMAGRKWDRWFAFGMEAILADRRDFAVTAKADFDAHAKVEKIAGPKGPLTLCTVKSDSRAIMKYARSEHGCGADIVVKIDSKGNVAIQTDQRQQLDLGDLVAMIKLEEQKARGTVHCDDPDKLRADGTIDETWDVWHFAFGTNVLNGSHSAQGISPTKISLERLVELVKIAMNTTYYEPKCSAMCTMGICPAMQGAPCSLKPYGLNRCRAIQASAQA